MKKLIYMSALALIAAGGIFWSCQKDEDLNPGDELMLKGGTLPITWNDVCADGTNDLVLTLVGSGNKHIQQLKLGVWEQIANVSGGSDPLVGTLVDVAAGTYYFRYKVGKGSFTEIDPIVIENCGCTYEGNLLTGRAVSCDETREAIYTFSSQDGVGSFKIQGGLTNFTGENATVYINGVEVVFNTSVTEGASVWEQGSVGDYTIGQRTPGSSSNRNIRVEGSLDECSEVVIRIVWNSTNSGGVITGEWSVAGEETRVAGLTCLE